MSGNEITSALEDSNVKEISLWLGILALWIVLNRWVLPWFGVSTCMSGGCALSRSPCCGAPAAVGQDKEVQNLAGSKGESP